MKSGGIRTLPLSLSNMQRIKITPTFLTQKYLKIQKMIRKFVIKQIAEDERNDNDTIEKSNSESESIYSNYQKWRQYKHSLISFLFFSFQLK